MKCHQRIGRKGVQFLRGCTVIEQSGECIVTQIFELVRGLVREEGLAVLLVEQNARSALSVADRGVVLNLGRVVADDDAAVLAGDDQLRHAYLGF